MWVKEKRIKGNQLNLEVRVSKSPMAELEDSESSEFELMRDGGDNEGIWTILHTGLE